MTEQDYHADVAARGYEPAIVKQWRAGLLNDEHTHGADLYLYVLDGGMTVTVDGQARHLGPGDACEVPADIRHSELVGHEGVRFQVATRQPGR